MVRVAFDLDRPAFVAANQDAGAVAAERAAVAKKSGTPGVISSGCVVYGRISAVRRGGGCSRCAGQGERRAHDGEEPPPAHLVGELGRPFGELVLHRFRELAAQVFSAVQAGSRAGFRRCRVSSQPRSVNVVVRRLAHCPMQDRASHAHPTSLRRVSTQRLPVAHRAVGQRDRVANAGTLSSARKPSSFCWSAAPADQRVGLAVGQAAQVREVVRQPRGRLAVDLSLGLKVMLKTSDLRPQVLLRLAVAGDAPLHEERAGSGP